MMKTYQMAGFRVLEYEELNSTNVKADEIADNKCKHKDVIITKRQSNGRGQATNRWESEDDKNITMTIILKPDDLNANRQFIISMAISLGIVDFLCQYKLEDVSIKWPNDIYVGDKKICGILIENSLMGMNIMYSLCGIGLNINQSVFISDAPNPVSLFQLINSELELSAVLEHLLNSINKYISNLTDYKFVENQYLSCLYRKQGYYNWRDEDCDFRAKILGISEYGQLVLKDDKEKIRTYNFKEVKYL